MKPRDLSTEERLEETKQELSGLKVKLSEHAKTQDDLNEKLASLESEVNLSHKKQEEIEEQIKKLERADYRIVEVRTELRGVSEQINAKRRELNVKKEKYLGAQRGVKIWEDHAGRFEEAKQLLESIQALADVMKFKKLQEEMDTISRDHATVSDDIEKELGIFGGLFSDEELLDKLEENAKEKLRIAQEKNEEIMQLAERLKDSNPRQQFHELQVKYLELLRAAETNTLIRDQLDIDEPLAQESARRRLIAVFEQKISKLGLGDIEQDRAKLNVAKEEYEQKEREFQALKQKQIDLDARQQAQFQTQRQLGMKDFQESLGELRDKEDEIIKDIANKKKEIIPVKGQTEKIGDTIELLRQRIREKESEVNELTRLVDEAKQKGKQEVEEQDFLNARPEPEETAVKEKSRKIAVPTITTKPRDIHVLEQNVEGSDFIIGDVHGNVDALKYNLLRLAEDDRLFIVGDLIDRGKNSLDVIRRIKAYQAEQPESIHVVRGNHENWCLDAIAGLEQMANKLIGIPYKKFRGIDGEARRELEGKSALDSAALEEKYGPMTAIKDVQLHLKNGGGWLLRLFKRELDNGKIKLIDGRVEYAEDSEIKLVKDFIKPLPTLVHVKDKRPFNVVHAAMPLSDLELKMKIHANDFTLTPEQKSHATLARESKGASIDRKK